MRPRVPLKCRLLVLLCYRDHCCWLLQWLLDLGPVPLVPGLKHRALLKKRASSFNAQSVNIFICGGLRVDLRPPRMNVLPG